MSVPVRNVGEGFTTLATLIRLRTGVLEHMAFESVFPPEQLSTHLTFEVLHLRVCAEMPAEVGATARGVRARVAPVLAGGAVDRGRVLPQPLLPCKRLPALARVHLR